MFLNHPAQALCIHFASISRSESFHTYALLEVVRQLESGNLGINYWRLSLAVYTLCDPQHED